MRILTFLLLLAIVVLVSSLKLPPEEGPSRHALFNERDIATHDDVNIEIGFPNHPNRGEIFILNRVQSHGDLILNIHEGIQGYKLRLTMPELPRLPQIQGRSWEDSQYSALIGFVARTDSPTKSWTAEELRSGQVLELDFVFTENRYLWMAQNHGPNPNMIGPNIPVQAEGYTS